MTHILVITRYPGQRLQRRVIEYGSATISSGYPERDRMIRKVLDDAARPVPTVSLREQLPLEVQMAQAYAEGSKGSRNPTHAYQSTGGKTR